jgi:hypothetical protein
MNVGFDVQLIGMQAAVDIKKNSGDFCSHTELGCPTLANWISQGFPCKRILHLISLEKTAPGPLLFLYQSGSFLYSAAFLLF